MSIRLGDIFVAIRGDDSQLKSDLAGAKGQVTSWASGLAGSMKGLVGGAVLGGVTALAGAVAGIGVAAFSAASDFDAATKKMQSQLGLTDEMAATYGDTLKNVFANNFGDSIEDVADGLTKVDQAFSRIAGGAGENLQEATESAFALRDAFDVDINEAASAAVTLMDNFGLSSKQAFDFLAYGFQNGMDGSGDFLDTIGEYATQFSNGGADASQFFSILESGLQGGMLGTDKAADAFKEFRLRIQDGSQLTADGLKMLGINAGDFTKQLANGSLSAIDAFENVTYAISQIEDPTKRMQIGAALLGSQFEDLGDSFIAGLSTAGSGLSDMEGAISKLNKQYETIPSFFEGLKRRAIVAIAPLGGFLLDSFNKALPGIEEMFSGIEQKIKDFVAKSSFTWEPDYKKITLGDLFSFVKEEGIGVSRINIGDWFDMTIATTGIQKITIGDFLDFSADPEKTEINIADYITLTFGTEGDTLNIADYFVVDFTKAGGIEKLQIGDFVAFLSEGQVNIADYFVVDFTKFGEITKLKIGDLFDFAVTSDGGVLNIADYFTLDWAAAGLTKLSIGDVLGFSQQENGRGTLNIADYFTLDWTAAAFTRLEIGDVVNFAIGADATRHLNIADYFMLDWTKAGFTKLTIGDVLGFSQQENGRGTLNIADYFKLEWTEAAFTRLELGDLFNFAIGVDGTSHVNIADYFTLDWTGAGLTKLKISDFIDLSFDGKGNLSIASPKWDEFISKLEWPSEIAGFAWSTWLTVLNWPAATAVFAWSSWVSKLSWPESIVSFNWKSFITGINLSTFVPKFPGWATLFQQLNPFGDAPEVNPGVSSEGSIGGATRSLLRSSGPAVVIEAVNVNNRADAEALAYGIAKRYAYR